MNYLIVGSAGYIGSNVCKFLLEKGHNVFPIDLKFGKDYKDYSDFELLNKQIDVCVFLAAIPGIKNCEENTDNAIAENILKPIKFFRRLHKNENINTYFISSIAANNPQSSFYAMTKYILEREIIWNYSSKFKIIRLSNVYGGINFENKNTVISTFIKQIKNNEDITVNGDRKSK